MSVLEHRGLILNQKIARQLQEIKQEEVEVKVPGDKNPEYVFYDFFHDIFTIDSKSMKLTVEDEWTREVGLETGAACTKFMSQPVTSEADLEDIEQRARTAEEDEYEQLKVQFGWKSNYGRLVSRGEGQRRREAAERMARQHAKKAIAEWIFTFNRVSYI